MILLFGMPRSGTTWIGKIFDSHPDTLYRHEPDSRGLLNFMPLFPQAADDAAAAPGVQRFVQALPATRDEKVSASLPLFRKRYQSEPAYQLRRLSVYAAKALSRATGPLPVPDPAGRRAAAEGRLVWKSIESLGRIGSLVRLLPAARAVVILRHPGGFVSSVQRGESKGRFDAGDPASEDWPLFDKLLQTPAAAAQGLDAAALRRMSPLARLAIKWALYNEHALQQVQGEPRVKVLRYEDLCENPAAVTQALFAHCGLAFDTQTEAFVSASTSTHRSEYYSVFKDPLASAHKWRGELQRDAVREVLDTVRPFRAGTYYPE